MNNLNGRHIKLFFICLGLAVLSGTFSALSIFKTRTLTTELAKTQKQIQGLQTEHNALLIEKGLYGSLNIIETKAKKHLKMVMPRGDDVVVLSINKQSGEH